MPTLRQKSLKCAIRNIKSARTRKEANDIYLKWEVFHTDTLFKKAIKEMQDKFSK